MSLALPVIIATRGSPLAVAQSTILLEECRKAFPLRDFELRIVKTAGDRLQTTTIRDPIALSTKGLFTKELEVALLNGEADMAIHSLKDLPTDLPSGLMLGAVSKREDVRDVVLHRQEVKSNGSVLGFLREGATVGTCSTRRVAQLKYLRPDLKFAEHRGNVLTRIQKLSKGKNLDAIVLAAAGLARLGYACENGHALRGEGVPNGIIAHFMEADLMPPCVGQAALAVEIRLGDKRMAEICEAINDPETHECVVAERAFLAGMGGGCQSPVAAYARVVSGALNLKAAVYLEHPPRFSEISGLAKDAEKLGQQLAAKLKGK